MTADKHNQSQAGQSLQVVVFELDNEEFAVPINEIRDIVQIPDITPIPNSPAYILGIMNLRGKIIPVLDLERRFMLKRENSEVPRHIMVAETNDMLLGVRVDKVTEVLQIPNDAIQPTPKVVTNKISTEYLFGVAVLTNGAERQDMHHILEDKDTKATHENGRILVLLDINKVLSLDELTDMHESMQIAPEEVTVSDSSTVSDHLADIPENLVQTPSTPETGLPVS